MVLTLVHFHLLPFISWLQCRCLGAGLSFCSRTWQFFAQPS